ncbi:MAG: DUF4442 domain-containing protein [Bdellovibrionaceae bacterium]|nr:DUF4442 domain-containing protein [Pseudobdellovibrionaceae bacterium]
MKESIRTKIFRILMNWYPMFLGTGGKITFIAANWRRVELRLKLNIWTYNYVGTIFGGSQFSATDPFLMVMLIKILGNDYIVWDKAGSIRFLKPGRGRLRLVFEYSDDEIALIQDEVARHGKYEFTKGAEWLDQDGVAVSKVEKLVYVSTKSFDRERRKRREDSRQSQS